jgi:glutathione S-transferase
MKIFADPITINCRKVIAGLELMGAPYELSHVDYFKGEQKSDAYLALNPNASIPAMVDGDLVLWESNAILQYAADKIGNDAVYPRDPARRADLNRWLFWESANWFPACYTFLVENCVKPLLGGQADEQVLNNNLPQFHKLAGILNQRLSDRDFIMGAQPTIADIALASPMHLHGWQQLPLSAHPHLKRWITQSMESLPSWQRTWVGQGFTLQRPLQEAA